MMSVDDWNTCPGNKSLSEPEINRPMRTNMSGSSSRVQPGSICIGVRPNAGAARSRYQTRLTPSTQQPCWWSKYRLGTSSGMSRSSRSAIDPFMSHTISPVLDAVASSSASWMSLDVLPDPWPPAISTPRARSCWLIVHGTLGNATPTARPRFGSADGSMRVGGGARLMRVYRRPRRRQSGRRGCRSSPYSTSTSSSSSAAASCAVRAPWAAAAGVVASVSALAAVHANAGASDGR